MTGTARGKEEEVPLQMWCLLGLQLPGCECNTCLWLHSKSSSYISVDLECMQATQLTDLPCWFFKSGAILLAQSNQKLCQENLGEISLLHDDERTVISHVKSTH